MYIVLTTESDLEKAKSLAKELLESKLAACISTKKTNSMYWWQGKIEESEEIQLVIKTNFDKINYLIKQIKLLHSYETPEIVFWEISSTQCYKEWMISII